MISFLKKILPTTGIYCVYRGDNNAQSFWNTIDEAYTNAIAQDSKEYTIFIAQCSFDSPTSRKQDNAKYARSYWLDIDCGVDKPYATQKDGVKALRDFCIKTQIPLPAIVNSGNGLYAHWPLQEDVPVSQWKGVAVTLKALCTRHAFFADPARTADTASVLRPIGSHNKKNGGKKPVKLIYDTPPLRFSEFCEIVEAAAKGIKIDTTIFQPPAELLHINDEFLSGLNNDFESNPDLVADKCHQIGGFRAAKGNVSEPLWYAGIGVLRYTVNGADTIHAWSSGYPGYSISETHSKIEQHKMPPTTCHHFGQINAPGCVGCSHNGKIKTPLVLGRVFTSIAVEDDRVEIPKGFILTDAGIFLKEDNQRIYPYDIHPTKIAYDETLGYEVVTLQHKTPHKQDEEFTIRSSLVHDPKNLLIALHDNHVQITGADAKKLMVAFMEQYIAKLRAKKQLVRLHSQMGWQDYNGTKVFVLGDRVYRAGEEPLCVGFARNVPEVIKSYTTEGDINVWKQAINLFNTPGLEAHAFLFLVGAFGAPLIHFTGYAGAMVSAVGHSGVGKSLMQYLTQSVYGDYKKLVMVAEDTSNALISRLGVGGSLPMTIDEVSNMDAQRVSDLAYRITQGRDKVRLTKSAVEKSNINSWCTLAAVSSNHSLIDKLAALKGDASAEINRIFEFYVPNNEVFMKEYGSYIHNIITQNYGHAGQLYVQYLVDSYAEHTDKIKLLADKIMRDGEMKNDERFWCAILAVGIYGGMLAKKLGLMNLNIAPIYAWAINAVKTLRINKKESVCTSIDVVGEFLDKYAANVLIVGKANNIKTDKTYVGFKVPVAAVYARYEIDTKQCFISRSMLNEFLHKKYMSPSTIRKELEGISPRSPLLDTSCRKTLTSGINGMCSTAVHTWVFDLSHPALGNVSMELVKNINIEEGKANGAI